MLQIWGPKFDSLRAAKISRHAYAGDAMVAFSRTTVTLEIIWHCSSSSRIAIVPKTWLVRMCPLSIFFGVLEKVGALLVPRCTEVDTKMWALLGAQSGTR